MTGRRLAILPIVVAVVGLTVASGAERTHTVAIGDSMSAIAMHYYGDPDRVDVLMRYNDRETTVLHPGETLQVPFAVPHRVRRGDAGSVLAQRYLGRASTWPQVAELNGLVPEAPLSVGRTVVFPAVLRHRLARGESLAAIAERRYGDPAMGSLLQAFNRIDDPRSLSIGQNVEIPVLDLVLVERAQPAPQPPPPRPEPEPEREPERERKTEPETESATVVDETAPETPPAPAPDTPVWFSEAIAEAERAFEAGAFEACQDAVDELTDRANELERSEDRVRLWRLTAFVHVAFDREDEACRAWSNVLNVEPGAELDPVEVSPKIRDRFAACAEDT